MSDQKTSVKTYAITGVASGIGATLARLLKADGHTIIGFDIVETKENVDVFIPLDLSSNTAIATAISMLDCKLDGLCNNAGLPPRNKLEASILRVNFLGQRTFTKAILPKLNSGASIVNMASRAGHGWPDNIDQVKKLSRLDASDHLDPIVDKLLDQFIESEQLNATRCYNLSKEAMILWTIAESELMTQRGFRINSLSPGGIQTTILADFALAFGEAMKKNIERAGRAGKPEEVAAVAAFLLSPQSHWIKGADIPIDGGIGAFGLCDRLNLKELQS